MRGVSTVPGRRIDVPHCTGLGCPARTACARYLPGLMGAADLDGLGPFAFCVFFLPRSLPLSSGLRGSPSTMPAERLGCSDESVVQGSTRARDARRVRPSVRS